MQTVRDQGSTSHDGLFKVALVGGAVFLLWRAARGLTGMAWSVFGLALAARWSGLWPW